MKIYTFVDWSTACVYTTMGWGVQGLTEYIPSAEVVAYSLEQLSDRDFDGDSDSDTILIFEIGNPQHTGWSTKKLRSRFPNAKFVALCSDTVYYQMNGLSLQMDPDGIDLHLEVMPQSVEWLQNKGIAAEFFRWGISDKLINKAVAYANDTFFQDYVEGIHNAKSTHLSYKKNIDFIGVYHPGTISNPQCWRHHAVKYLEENGYSFTQGGGNGHQDNSLERLFSYYTRSKFTLGTTSHNRPELTRLGCMKFFRDELGPLFHSVLIYDNHPNVKLRYNYVDQIVPTYDYDSFYSITCIAREMSEEYRQIYLDKQQKYVFDHCFEKELLRNLVKHNILKKELISESI